jgi:hypothetical protein
MVEPDHMKAPKRVIIIKIYKSFAGMYDHLPVLLPVAMFGVPFATRKYSLPQPVQYRVTVNIVP